MNTDSMAGVKKPEGIMRTMLMVGLIGWMCSGCAMLKQEAASRVDLGDGMVFDVIPVGAAVTGANAVVPGSGAVLDKIEKRLAAKREAKLGPFNGLPYTTTRSVILKTGVVIPESDIAKIVETLTPIVPAAVTRVIDPASLRSYAVASPAPIEAGPAMTETAEGGVLSADPAVPPLPTETTDAVDDLLQAIGGAAGVQR
jgi:hypothetical protein